MGEYILSNANRFYVALESAYGQAAMPSAAGRITALRVDAQQMLEARKRIDKTGSRTYLGASRNARRRTAFDIHSYLTAWNNFGSPSYGVLFQAALGGTPELCQPLTIGAVQNQAAFQTPVAHGLTSGSAVSYAGEIRFVTSTPDSINFALNAPFSNAVTIGGTLAPTITYRTSTVLPSLSVYDYWDPTAVASRILTGAAVDTCEIVVNGDYHEFMFSGPGADLISSNTFVAGDGGLSSYPLEPALDSFDASPIPGYLGQVWLGATPSQFFTLASASVEVKNNIALRSEEFGSSVPRAICAGLRQVTSKIRLFAQNDAQTAALYYAAKQRVPVSALLQLGQQQGQLMAIYLPQVMPAIPVYEDSQTQLQWQFQNNVSQGIADDEIYIAFA
ncbi:MAG: hypothetical protein JO108_32185 [Acidobacteriaceae bacterium]|nr:hypothetical protein [Acidobacteriaceae bacterium]